MGFVCSPSAVLWVFIAGATGGWRTLLTEIGNRRPFFSGRGEFSVSSCGVGGLWAPGQPWRRLLDSRVFDPRGVWAGETWAPLVGAGGSRRVGETIQGVDGERGVPRTVPGGQPAVEKAPKETERMSGAGGDGTGRCDVLESREGAFQEPVSGW